MTILKEWVYYFPYDFRDIKMVNSLNHIKDRCFILDEDVIVEFNKILAYLAVQVWIKKLINFVLMSLLFHNKYQMKQIGFLEKYEDYLQQLNFEIRSKLKNNLTDVTSYLFIFWLRKAYTLNDFRIVFLKFVQAQRFWRSN